MQRHHYNPLSRLAFGVLCAASATVLSSCGNPATAASGYANATVDQLRDPATWQKAHDWCRTQPNAETLYGCKSMEIAFYLTHAYGGQAEKIATSPEPYSDKNARFFNTSIYAQDPAAKKPAKQEEAWCGVHAILKAHDVQAFQRYSGLSKGCAARYQANALAPTGAQ
jgi:hypothetical protein